MCFSLTPGLSTPVQGTSGIRPGAVRVDLSAAQPKSIAVLLRMYPGLLLIGVDPAVDPASDELLVFSSHSARALSTDALLEILEKGLGMEKPRCPMPGWVFTSRNAVWRAGVWLRRVPSAAPWRSLS